MKRDAIVLWDDDHSGYTWVNLTRKKTDASRALEQFLCVTRADSEVCFIRTGHELHFLGPFQAHCLSLSRSARIIRSRESSLTFTRSIQWVRGKSAVRGVAMMEATSLAARVLANHIFHIRHLPEKTDRPWGQVYKWPCHSLNLTVTTTNHGMISPYEVWYDKSLRAERSLPRSCTRLSIRSLQGSES